MKETVTIKNIIDSDDLDFIYWKKIDPEEKLSKEYNESRKGLRRFYKILKQQ